MSSHEDGPPRKSRRIGSKRKSHRSDTPRQDELSNTNSNVSITNTGSLNTENIIRNSDSLRIDVHSIVAAAIPTITESVIAALQATGLIRHEQGGSNSESAIHNQLPTTPSTTHANSGQSSTLNSINDSGAPGGTVPIIPVSSNQPNNINNRLRPILPGSRDIPALDLSPSVHMMSTSVTGMTSSGTTATVPSLLPSRNVFNSLASGTCTTQSSTHQCNTCNIKSSQTYNVGRPLTLGVDSKIKSQIWANEFVNFDSLLPKKELKNPKFKFQDGEQEGEDGPGFVKQQYVTTKIVNMTQWLEAFHVYVAIFCEKYPTSSPNLMRYANIVTNLAKKSSDMAALIYDQDFRKMRQTDPINMKWENIAIDLYNEALAEGLSSKFKATEQLFLGKGKGGKKGQKKNTCHTYNNEGICTKPNCRFRHSCQHCAGSHPRKSCRSWLSQNKPYAKQSSQYREQPMQSNTHKPANGKK